MKKLIITLLLNTIFLSVANAEIIKQHNEFTNTDNIISSFENNSVLNIGWINNIALKSIQTNNETLYYLFLSGKGSSKDVYTTLEPLAIKLSNGKIYYLNTQSEDNYSEQRISAKIPNELVLELKTESNFKIQVPVFTRYKEQVRYIELNIPKTITDEWKTVIK